MMKNDNDAQMSGSILDLVLRVKWYEMIQCGEKREEYRKIGAYWSKRLCHQPAVGKCRERAQNRACVDFDVPVSCWSARPFAFVRFHRAYTSTTMTFRIAGIEIGEGKPEWGASPNKSYYIIKLGKRIS